MLFKFKYHKNLAPDIWESPTKMNPLVVHSLKMIAAEFVNYLCNFAKLPVSVADIQDVFVHGSIANYYWDKYSDIDLCIVADLSKLRNYLHSSDDYILFKGLLTSWYRVYDISIFGRGIDLKMIDIRDTNKTLTMIVGPSYSLKKDRWEKTPVRLTKSELRTQCRIARIKYRAIMRQCRYMLRHKMPSEYVDAYLVNLQKVRLASATYQDNHPVTSTTMAFKMVRNTGTFRKLRKMSKGQRSKKFRLE